MIPFKTSEFIITREKTVPVDICDKIWKFHIVPMLWIRQQLGIKIWASQKSGYRPVWYEKEKGRSGNSQHTFKGKGAVDWTCSNFQENKEIFLELILEHTEYTRVAIYNGFIHCDHKPNESGKREIYSSNSKSEWEFLKYVA